MHLQQSVEDYDVFVRSLSIGPETMVMKFRPELPMHERYAVEHGFLSPDDRRRGGHHLAAGQRVLPVGVQLVRDARQGRRRCTPSTTPTPARTWRSPRCTTTSRGRWPRCCGGASSASSPGGHCGWTRTPPATSRSPTGPTCRTRRSWPATAGWPTSTSTPTGTPSSAPTQLGHVDEMVHDWVRSADFDDLLVGTVQATYPPDEHDRFVAHFRGLIGAWLADRA